MNASQRALIEKLTARLGAKAVITDPADIAPWTIDWRQRFHGSAPAIVAPGDIAGVQLTVAAAREAGVPLVPQGGNTSMVGGATPPADGSALILSLRRLNHIRSIDPDAGLAVAEAGVILEHLHGAAEGKGMRFPLTLGARGSATVGGLVSTNAGGTQVLRFGTMRALVAGIEAVLPDGELYEGLSPLKKDNRGYDIRELLIGAEGTLGVVTAATLRLVPLPGDRATGWIGVESPARALDILRAMERRSGNAVESFELVPQSALDLVLKHIPGTRAPFAEPYPWLVLVDYVTPEPGAQAALETLLGEMLEIGLALNAVVAASEAQADSFWRLRDSISEAERAEGPTMAHDISVAVDRMPAFMVDAAREIEQAFPGVRATGFGHLGDGNVHFHVNAPTGTTDAERWRREVGEPASHMVYDLVNAAGGSISAEHGIGQMKREELERLSSPARMTALRAIKRAFDPRELLNPGKLVTLAPERPRP